MERLTALALAGIASVIVLLTLKASVIAFNLSISLARPEFFSRVQHAYVARPWRATAVGVANTAFLLFAALLLLQTEPLALIGLLLLVSLAAIHILGRNAYYQSVEARLRRIASDRPEDGGYVRGAIVAELSFLVPVLGQALYLAVTMRCAGAVIMAMISRPGSSKAGEEVG